MPGASPEVSDIELMELADGSLAEPRRRAVEAEVARRPELQQRLEVFRLTGKTLARLFDPVIDAPVPPELVNTIRRTRPAPYVVHSASGHAPGRGRPGNIASPRRRVSGGAGLALAAALAAAAGVGTVLWSLNGGDGDGFAAAPLARALESTPSAQTAGLALEGYGPGLMRPDLSFRHKDGRYCRQYELSFEAGRGFVGYACRATDGRWQVVKEAEIPAGRIGAPDAIRPAGDHPALKVIDDAVEQVARGDALEPDKELSLIRRGWPTDDAQ